MSMYGFLEMKVGQAMTRAARTVAPELPLYELEKLFEEFDYNAFPVVSDGQLVGFVTKFDFLKAFAFSPTQIVPHYDEIMQTKVADVMTRAVIHVEADAPLPRALQLMVDLKARSFPVLDASGQLVGVIAREDLIQALKATATH